MKMACISFEIKEGAQGFPYGVGQFQVPSDNPLVQTQAPVITLNFTAPWSVCTDEERKDTSVRNRKYKEWLESKKDTILAIQHDINSWSVEVEKYLRLKPDGNSWDTSTVYDRVTIFGLCDELGNPVNGMAAIEKRAKNLLANSKRLITVAKFTELVNKAKEKQAKEANPLLNADFSSLELPLD